MSFPRLLDAIGLTGCLTILLAMGLRLSAMTNDWGTLITAAVGLLLGYCAADMLSGIAHWFCDTFFEETTPIIGPMFIYPFRDHHRDPSGMTRHSFLELTGNSGWGFLLIGVPGWIANLGVGVDGFLTSCGAFLLATNIFHKWAHLSATSKWVRRLQKCRVILSPEQHARHHKDGRGAYCVTNGLMNPLLDRLTRTR